MKKPLDALSELLNGKVSHLGTRQLVEIHDTLVRARRDVKRSFMRLRLLSGQAVSDATLNRRLRGVQEASDSIKLLGGPETVRARIVQIQRELIRRLHSQHSQA
jgi:hypothetical protein